MTCVLTARDNSFSTGFPTSTTEGNFCSGGIVYYIYLYDTFFLNNLFFRKLYGGKKQTSIIQYAGGTGKLTKFAQN